MSIHTAQDFLSDLASILLVLSTAYFGISFVAFSIARADQSTQRSPHYSTPHYSTPTAALPPSLVPPATEPLIVASPVVSQTVKIITSPTPKKQPKTAPMSLKTDSVSQVPQAPIAPQKPSNAELRNLCKLKGIKWRNAHRKNRHLSSKQMITALQEKGGT